MQADLRLTDGKITIDQQVLTDAATVTWNLKDGSNSKVVLGGNRTLSITNAVTGDTGVILVQQGAGTTHNLTLPAGSVVIGGNTYTTTTTSGGIDVLGVYYDGVSYYWSVPGGAVGAKGAAGSTGTQGPTGAGTQGAQGNKGQKGAVGVQGIQGEAGQKGNDGTKGGIGDSGALSYDYNFTSSVLEQNPTSGYLGVNAAPNSWSTATEIYLSRTDDNSNDLVTILSNIDSNLSNDKGWIRISNGSNQAIFSDFAITDITIQSGNQWYVISVNNVDGTLVALGNDVAIKVMLNKTGDLGSPGIQGAKGATGTQGITGTGTQGTTGFQGAKGATGAGTQGTTGTGTQGATGTGTQGPAGAGDLQGNDPNNIVTMTGTNAISGSAKFTYDGAGDVHLEGKLQIDQQTITDAVTITFNPSNGSNASVTLGGNRTLAMSGWETGDTGVLVVKQDSTGGRTFNIDLGGDTVYLGNTSYTASSAANAVDVLGWYYDGTKYYVSIGYGDASTTGAKGETGLQGTTGPKGTVGPIGNTGPQGVTGTIGPIGNVGPKGITGPIGNVGPKGVTGPLGEKGLIGPLGEKGSRANR